MLLIAANQKDGVTALDYRTAGESHGAALLALIEGFPAGVRLDLEFVNGELRRRQSGFGRSSRQSLERDVVELLSGARNGVSLGSPIALRIANRDHRIDTAPPITCPRPGHADFAGSIKWLTTDCRGTLERASARETAARVAAGAMCRSLLQPFGIVVCGFVRQIGDVQASVDANADIAQLLHDRGENDLNCPDPRAAVDMTTAISEAGAAGDTVGGLVEVHAVGLPPGLGSCTRWQDKLDGRLMQAVGSVQAIKGVEVGAGFGVAGKRGSVVHDEMDFDSAKQGASSLGFSRRSNNAGGIEGGMTNGQPVVLRAVMKPISTLKRGLDTVDLVTRQAARSDYERSDVCAVPACSVVVENVVAFEIARALLAKCGGDTLGEVRAAYDHFLGTARDLKDNAKPNP